MAILNNSRINFDDFMILFRINFVQISALKLPFFFRANGE
ncbi:hypothetical protein LDG_7447 [Legionella drancourtii LLAP12]|uniref:Uncharacterized protein n=1 Tax=Legionella drancourtii LLAP12 TaxID=658187 RepID=G9EQA0_9GAMM|nr:hypothetical protein LDG_7447 [Legionella drancourtii LLAP12]